MAGVPVVTVTLALALPMFPATSWKRKATVVGPGGKSVLLSASAPPVCGARRAGDESRLSTAEPAPRKVARAGDALPRAPPGSVAVTVMAPGGVTTGDVLSSLTVRDWTVSLLPA